MYNELEFYSGEIWCFDRGLYCNTPVNIDEYISRVGYQFQTKAKNYKPSMKWWQDSLGIKLKGKLI